jgi:Cu2+-exporting ATPase
MTRAKKDGIAVPAAEKFEAITGKGVQATVDGREVAVVSPGYSEGEEHRAADRRVYGRR